MLSEKIGDYRNANAIVTVLSFFGLTHNQYCLASGKQEM